MATSGTSGSSRHPFDNILTNVDALTTARSWEGTEEQPNLPYRQYIHFVSRLFYRRNPAANYNNIKSIVNLRKAMNDALPLKVRRGIQEQINAYTPGLDTVESASLQSWDGKDLSVLALTEHVARIVVLSGGAPLDRDELSEGFAGHVLRHINLNPSCSAGRRVLIVRQSLLCGSTDSLVKSLMAGARRDMTTPSGMDDDISVSHLIDDVVVLSDKAFDEQLPHAGPTGHSTFAIVERHAEVEAPPYIGSLGTLASAVPGTVGDSTRQQYVMPSLVEGSSVESRSNVGSCAYVSGRTSGQGLRGVATNEASIRHHHGIYKTPGLSSSVLLKRGDSTLNILSIIRHANYLSGESLSSAAEVEETEEFIPSKEEEAQKVYEDLTTHGPKADEVNTEKGKATNMEEATEESSMENGLTPDDRDKLPKLDAMAEVVGFTAVPSRIILEVERIGKVARALENKAKSAESEAEDLRKKLSEAAGEFKINLVNETREYEDKPDWPDLEEVCVESVGNLFKDVITGSPTEAMLNMECPVFVWEDDHPLVPEIDEAYRFEAERLLPLIFALITGDLAYLLGHTGTGKTSFVEQVCARLGWPFYRVSFMDEIGRMELIGREILTFDEDAGAGVSRFEPGPLTSMYDKPVVILLDEYDSVTPGASYIFQPLFEGKDLEVMEDGGRIVRRHPMQRFIGSGNTTGSGDETGLYNATRPQSAAQVNRWTYYVPFQYMTSEEEWDLLVRRVPEADMHKSTLMPVLTRYIEEHRKAFERGQVNLPLSPRNVKAIGQMYCMFRSIEVPHDKALVRSVENVVIHRATKSDGDALSGILDVIVE